VKITEGKFAHFYDTPTFAAYLSERYSLGIVLELWPDIHIQKIVLDLLFEMYLSKYALVERKGTAEFQAKRVKSPPLCVFSGARTPV
jgi:hypothetical protein